MMMQFLVATAYSYNYLNIQRSLMFSSYGELHDILYF